MEVWLGQTVVTLIKLKQKKENMQMKMCHKTQVRFNSAGADRSRCRYVHVCE